MFTSEEATSAQMERIVGRALSQMSSMLQGEGMPRNVTIPTDPVDGVFENEAGEWVEYFKAGMPCGSAPVRNARRFE